MPFIQLQFRRGTATQWTSANPVLADGELAIESDTSKFKIGNGNASWTLLPYGGLVGPTGTIGNTVSIDVSFNGNIFVGRDVSFGGKLAVRNDVSFNTELRVGGNINIRSSAASISSGTGALIVAGGVGVGGNVWTGGNLVIGGDASFNNRLFVENDVSFGAKLCVQSDVSFNGNTSVALLPFYTGNATITPATNQLVTKKYVDENGGTILLGANNVWTANNTFNGNTSVAILPVYTGNASVTPATNQLVTKKYVDENGGTILLSGNNIWTANNTFNGSRFYVNADASFNSKLTVSGDASLNSNLFVGRNMIVGGDVSFNDNMSVQSDSSFNNRLYVGRQIGVGVTANSVYALDVLGNINLSGNLYLNNKLFSITSADISLNANLMVGADASFNGNVFIARTLNLRKTVLTGAAIGSPTSIAAATPIVEITGAGASTAYFNLANGSYAGQTLTIISATNGGGGGLFVNAVASNIIFNGSVCSQMRFSNAFQTVNLIWSADVNDWIVASWQGVNFGGVSMNFGTYTSGDITLGAAGRVNINPGVGGMVVGSDSSLNGNLSVGGTDSSFNGNLFVGQRLIGSGDVSFNQRLTVGGADSSFNGNLYIGRRLIGGGDVSFNQRLTVGGADSSFNGNLFVGQRLIGSGDVSFNQRLTVGGADSSFNGNLYVRQQLIGGGDVSFNQRLTVGGADSSFNGNLYIGRRLIGGGDVSFNQRLTVGGADSSFNGNLFVGGFINAEGFIERFVNVASSSGTYTADFNNGLIVYVNAFSGSSTPTLSITNLPTALNQSYVFTIVYSGPATSTYFSALNINGTSVPVSGSVSLTAASSYYIHQFCIFFTDATNLENNFVVQNFNSSAPLSLVSPSVSGNLSVNGNINLTGGNIFQNGTLFSGGSGGVGTSGNSLSLSGNLYVGGDVSFNGKLTGNGDVSFNGNLKILGYMLANSITAYSSITSTAGNMNAFNITSNNILSVVSTTPSVSNTTGALIVSGGAGVAGNLWASRINVNLDSSMNGNLRIGATTASTSTSTGALIVSGGVGVAGFINGISVGRGNGNYTTNTAIGLNALASNTEINNTAVGVNALLSNTTGNNNAAVGTYSLQYNTTGRENTAFGMNALINNTTGNFNTAVGVSAFYYGVDKIYNTAIGHGAGLGPQANFVGSYNTFIGSGTFQSGTGQYNTYLGYLAHSNGNHDNSTAIGVNSEVTTSNQIVLGRSTEFVSIPGTAASTSVGTGALRVVGGVGVGGSVNAISFNPTSDYRIKQNVHSLCDDASFNVDVLKPVSFVNTQLGKSDIGFIAHEVQEHYPYLVNGVKDGEAMQTLNYTGIIGILTKEVQELKKKVSYQETKTIEQEQRIQDLEKMVLDILANK